MSVSESRAPAVRQLVVALVATIATLLTVATDLGFAEGASFPSATPRAQCGPGSLPEGKVQGRVPAADYDSGRAARGYRCNARQVAHRPGTGGYKVLRYTDRAGHRCVYYDSTRTFPTDVFEQAQSGFGVVVVDVTRADRPRVTTTLTTPTMLSPHESLLLHHRRGLLAAVLGNAYAGPGVLELYDVRTDCRRPRLVSRTTEAVLGHESGWSPDGRTFYVASSGGQTFVALDVSDPARPSILFSQRGVNYHGLRLSDDGRTLYAAHIGNDLSGATLPGEGLRILDVGDIQDRRPDPQVEVLADLTWREGSIPQVAQPFTRDGRDYVLEVDEFSTAGLNHGSVKPQDATVGAARIIDVTDPRRPSVVSHLRLGVQQPAARAASIGDPGAGTPLGGYTAHYCSVPYREGPRIAACSMIGSGLRIFDLTDLRRPREAAYFNMPSSDGAAAFSQPAWDVRRRLVYYSDASSGLYAVRLTNGVEDLLRPGRGDAP
ncbi:LVIVD repeat-containing protein [Nocardioides rubriscoriae]|uniref:LVIVD repeat-containing protein n=1 Tax=Nocardioides rubriscoriae TaxID=642762 RepID=UPI0011DF8AB2|nr:PD40 domain-containing protein [Nocardioides rubriscoriae]